MSTVPQYVAVPSASELEAAVHSYVLQGFAVQQRTPQSATLRKPKQINVPIVVISALLCVIPLIIYFIVYATQSDQVVVISVGGADGGSGPHRPLVGRAGQTVGDDAPPSAGTALGSTSARVPPVAGGGAWAPAGADAKTGNGGTFSVRAETDRIAAEAQAAADARRAASEVRRSAATETGDGRPPEGLYPDPSDPSRLRWWDGERWDGEG